MRSMIPHHSIAINNARKASISDPRVREIAEMKLHIQEIERNGEQGMAELPARSAPLAPEMEREALKVLE